MKELDRVIQLLNGHVSSLKRNIGALEKGLSLNLNNLSDMKNSRVVSMSIYAKTKADMKAYSAALIRSKTQLETALGKLKLALREQSEAQDDPEDFLPNNVVPFRSKE